MKKFRIFEASYKRNNLLDQQLQQPERHQRQRQLWSCRSRKTWRERPSSNYGNDDGRSGNVGHLAALERPGLGHRRRRGNSRLPLQQLLESLERRQQQVSISMHIIIPKSFIFNEIRGKKIFKQLMGKGGVGGLVIKRVNARYARVFRD